MMKQGPLMKQKRLSAAIFSTLLVASLSGCGGGGDDEAGSPTALSVVPNTLTVTAAAPANGGPPAGTCVATYAGQFFVYGGAAPYRLDNTAPDAMVLSTNVVNDRGGSFTVTFTGVCVIPATIVVVDARDRQVTLTLNNKPSS